MVSTYVVSACEDGAWEPMGFVKLDGDACELDVVHVLATLAIALPNEATVTHVDDAIIVRDSAGSPLVRLRRCWR